MIVNKAIGVILATHHINIPYGVWAIASKPLLKRRAMPYSGPTMPSPDDTETARPSDERITDDALLEALTRDDKFAFQELTTRYLQKICRLAYRVVGNRQDAEDVAQEVFVTVWNRRHEWKAGEASFSTWLYRVATNRSIDIQRKRKTGGGSVELSEELIDHTDIRADERVSRRETQEMVMGCLKELPEKQMLALLYFYYEDMEIDEICLRLKATEDSVRSLLKRGKMSMRDVLAEKFDGDESKIALIAPYLVG